MTKTHIIPLTSIRGLAALVVVFAHSGLDFFWPLASHLHPFCWSNQAVDIFFVLSAFVLLHNYATGAGPAFKMRDYLAARIARIYPLHVLTMAVLGALAFVALRQGKITGEYKLAHVLPQLLMVNAWPVIGMERTWNYPAWSVSIEWFLYLFALPPLVRFGAIKSKGSAVLVALFVAIIAGTVSAYADGTVPITTGWVALLRGVCGFAAGWAIWSLYTVHRPFCEGLSKWGDGLAILSLLLLALAGLGFISLWCLVPVGPFFIAALSVEAKTMVSRVMHTRALVFLGEISYSLYMTHAVVAKSLNASVFRGAPNANPYVRFGEGLAYAGGILLLAWLVHHYIETPCRISLRKRLGTAPAQPRISSENGEAAPLI